MAPGTKPRPQISTTRLEAWAGTGPVHIEKRGNRYAVSGGGLSRECTGTTLDQCFRSMRAQLGTTSGSPRAKKNAPAAARA